MRALLLFYFLVMFQPAIADAIGATKVPNGPSVTKENKQSESIQKFSNDEALAISQAVLGSTLGNYQLTSSTGTTVNLNQFRGKPLVISLVYTSCFHICPMTTQNLHRVVKKARQVFGDDSFNVLTIGFDTPRDTPKAMGYFSKAQYAGADNWYFLSSDQATMAALTRDLGFIFVPSPAGFDHLIQATIIDSDGILVRQVYGMKPLTTHFVEPLKALIFNKKLDDGFFSSLTSKIKLFCTVYDPKQDRYSLNYSIFVGLFIGLILGGICFRILILEWRKSGSA